MRVLVFFCFFFQAEDGIRDLVRSRGLGDVYKRQNSRANRPRPKSSAISIGSAKSGSRPAHNLRRRMALTCSARSRWRTRCMPRWSGACISITLPCQRWRPPIGTPCWPCLLYTSDAADERSSVDLGGCRLIKKKNKQYITGRLIR